MPIEFNPAASMFLSVAATGAAGAETHTPEFGPVLFGLAVLVLGAKLGGILAARRGQPAVLGELLFGIVLANLSPFFFGDVARPPATRGGRSPLHRCADRRTSRRSRSRDPRCSREGCDRASRAHARHGSASAAECRSPRAACGGPTPRSSRRQSLRASFPRRTAPR